MLNKLHSAFLWGGQGSTLGSGTVGQLLQSHPELKSPIAGYHVVAGAFPTSSLTPGTSLPTVDVERTPGQPDRPVILNVTAPLTVILSSSTCFQDALLCLTPCAMRLSLLSGHCNCSEYIYQPAMIEYHSQGVRKWTSLERPSSVIPVNEGLCILAMCGGLLQLQGVGSSAHIVQPDLRTCGPSVVHVIDGVLLPFSPSTGPAAGG